MKSTACINRLYFFRVFSTFALYFFASMLYTLIRAIHTERMESMKRFIWIVSVCLLITTLLTAATFAREDTPIKKINMQLNGDRSITMAYGGDYRDLGATAVLTDLQTGEEEELAVTVSGAVDPDRVGVYIIRYSASAEGILSTVYRRVQVTDNQNPSITLVSEPGHYTLPGKPYEEEGFTATDDYDGDLTQQVKRLFSKAFVTYIVRDSSGNMASATRPMVYDDPVPPELTLHGDSMTVVNLGTTYVDPGYTALDNCDGDITQQVQVSGSVDTQQVGRTTLTYTVKDNYDNLTTATRMVFVKEPSVTKVNDPTKGSKFIYLTFDDGPGPRTGELLDILKKYNVQATFFVVNTRFISTVSRVAAEGHAVGIHSATHKFRKIYASERAYFRDLYDMQDIIEAHTGQESTLLRFPGGSSNTVSRFRRGIMTRLAAKVQEAGFTYFDWNVDSGDAGSANSANEVYSNVINGVAGKEHSVVLMHDIKGHTIDAIERIIVWGLENGYTFLPLTPDSPTCHHGINN